MTSEQFYGILSRGSNARNGATQDDVNHQLTDKPVRKYPQDAGLGTGTPGSQLWKGSTSSKTNLSLLSCLKEYVKANDIILVSSWKKRNKKLVKLSQYL